MSEPTKGKKWTVLDELEMYWLKNTKCGENIKVEVRNDVQAIRRLIEEQEKWKKRAMHTLPELLELRQKVRTFEKQAKKGSRR
jgi:hypothetical protein